MAATALLILGIALQLNRGGRAPDKSNANLSLYEGAWQITRSAAAPGTKPERLQNECSQIGRYFACQQTVNGKVGGLLIFIPTETPGRYYTQTIKPEGQATGRDDLEISGDRWTYTSRRLDNGKTTYYRTTNVFSGKNRIHFEQAESTDGKQWSVRNSGDEIRVSSGTSQH